MKKKDKKKPHLVGRERILRQYERGKLVTNCHILYPMGNDGTMIDVFHKTIQRCHVIFDQWGLVARLICNINYSILMTCNLFIINLKEKYCITLFTVTYQSIAQYLVPSYKSNFQSLTSKV